jgi:hypothetical protein
VPSEVQDFPAGVVNYDEDVERPEEIVWTQRKSQAQIAEECCLISAHQPGDGPLSRGRRIYLATVRAETLNPSLVSSAWILR